jgi:hypothetical protein
MESGHETEDNDIDINEPAFPCEWTEETEELKGTMVKRKFGTTGMALRDYFAAKALAGMMVHEQNQICVANGTDNHVLSLVESAYRVADAMLEARTK